MTTKLINLTCSLCGQQYDAPASTPRAYQGLCPIHFSNDALREMDRIDTARTGLLAGTPDTLTLKEWLAIIARYAARCAICRQVHYSRIDIWIPAQGLCAENVIPTCTACHWHKSHSWRDALSRVNHELAQEVAQ